MKGRNKRRAASKQHAKAQPKVILCAVCGKGDGKYKCPKCRTPFCCVQCSKDHKLKCPALTNKTPEPTDATINDGVATAINEESKYLSQKELKSKQPKRKRQSRSGNESDDSHDDEPGWNITPEMKKRIHQSTWLRKELQDGGLRQLIEQIDAASDNEADDDDDGRKKYQRANNKCNTVVSARELALARTKHSHPKFSSFIDEMLLTAGVLQPATDASAGAGGGDALMSILEGRGPLVLAPVPRRSGATNTTSEKESGSDSDSNSSSDENSESDESDSSEDSDGSNHSGKSE